jgi:hypothetical protein
VHHHLPRCAAAATELEEVLQVVAVAVAAAAFQESSLPYVEVVSQPKEKAVQLQLL